MNGEEARWDWRPTPRVPSDAGRVESLILAIRQALRGQDLAVPAEGLPAWIAGLCLGLPEGSLDIPAQDTDEGDVPDALLDLVEATWALRRWVVLPPAHAPVVEVSATELAARRVQTYQSTTTLKDPKTALNTTHSGPIWLDSAGESWTLPPDLCRALADFQRGPPGRYSADQTESAWSDQRFLWWGQLSQRLLGLGVRIHGGLAAKQVELWERPRPTLSLDSSGSLTLGIAPGPVMARQDRAQDLATSVLDQLAQKPDLTPLLRLGGAQRLRVVLTEGARAATSQLNDARQRLSADPSCAAQLMDAPESLLDPELFDLSEFSDRVIGLADVMPVYRPRQRAMGERWSFLGQDGTEVGPDSGRFTKAQWAAIWAKLREAAQAGRSYVQAEGCWFRVPPESDADEGEAAAAELRAELVVKTNIEDLEHVVDDEGDGLAVGPLPPPPAMRGDVVLFPHQEVGIRWLAGHALWNAESTDHGMLADDMGLGKTLQVLALMSHLHERGHRSPMLLVAPLSLLENWRQEADHFFPGRMGRPLVLGGSMGRKQVSAGEVRAAPWVLASYEALRRHQLELGRVPFELMVLDESHRIKNPSAGVTRAALAMVARRRLALTGTPVQNTLADLWSQFDWLAPGWLGDLASFDVRMADQGDETALERLRDQVGPRILRRLKHSTLANQLPPLHQEGDRYRPLLPMTAAQASLYEAIIRDKSGDGKKGSFGLLHRLFQVCSCPRMVGEPDMADPKQSWLLQLLDGIAQKGEKVLIFAEWYELQDRLIGALGKRHGIHIDRVNGMVEAGERLHRVQRFNNQPGFGVLVLGPRSGGVGLNITGANHVVHYTRHWNPANEAQATDRAYRIGAKRPVHVYRPILTHPRTKSIEVHLDELLRDKAQLAEQVIVPTAHLSVAHGLERAVLHGGG